MEAARRTLSYAQNGLDERLAAPLQPDDFAKILRLHPASASPAHRYARPAAISPNEMSAALDLVHEAAATIRNANERIRDSEARTQALLQRAAEELKTAEARAAAAEALANAAEARAADAQQRAEEAENWLRQIFATISQELPNRA